MKKSYSKCCGADVSMAVKCHKCLNLCVEIFPSTNKQEWEDEFDKRFSIAAHGELPLCEFNLRSVKSFITSQIAEATEKAREEAYKDGYRKGNADLLGPTKDALTMVAEYKKDLKEKLINAVIADIVSIIT